MANTSSTTRRVDIPTAGSYLLDPDRSSIDIRTRHMFGLGGVTGSVKIASGQIDVDPSVPKASVTVVVDATSFDTGNARRDGDVHSAKFLHTEEHPEFTFRAAKLTQDGGSWALTGDLTVKGVSRPVTLAVESVEMIGRGFRARATTRIDRYAHGVTAYKGVAAQFLDAELTIVAEPI
jgi:polyisoprenoid-binding protein YceI